MQPIHYVYINFNRSIQSVKKQNEQLQMQVAQLQKSLKEKDVENKQLLKKLEKLGKDNQQDLKQVKKKKSKRRSSSSSSSSSDSGNDENLKILGRMNKNSLLMTQQLKLSLKELHQRRSIREESNKKEEVINHIQKECLRKCNQYLSIILSDFQSKWNSFGEIDIIKKNDTTIILNRLQEKIDQQTTQYLTICEINLWESEIKYQTAKDLIECYQNSIEEILLLQSVS